MVARLIRTLTANALLNAARILQGTGAALLPRDAPTPPQHPGNGADEDVPPVEIPPEARAMIAEPTRTPPAEEAPSLAGSLAARRKQALS